MSTPTFDIDAVRERFPALKQPQVYFDNAGGSQILGEVADSIKEYLYTNNVQLGATYNVGKHSTEKYTAGIKAGADYINASPDEIVIGPSTTQLFRNLSIALLPKLATTPNAEIIISTVDHEANIAAWVFLAKTLSLTIKWWTPTDSPTNPHLTPSSLRPLLSPNTRLVTCTHTSNLLGSITDILPLSRLVHTIPHALLCVDGVAYAPHRPIDVKALEVDFYCFSWYKVYGPHIAQLYASRAAQDSALTSLGHFFKQGWSLEEKLGLAGASYELVQTLPLVAAYSGLVGWEGIVAHEVALQEVLLGYLRSKPEVYKIWGEPSSDAGLRVPLISFTVEGREPLEVVEAIEKRSDFGFRSGHMYSLRLVEGVFGIGQEGVVRVSMLHYNSLDEIERFVKTLDAEVCGS